MSTLVQEVTIVSLAIVLAVIIQYSTVPNVLRYQ